ncbi:MAG: PKD domain-containing protein [Candidatus Dormibacteria bacterium]
MSGGMGYRKRAAAAIAAMILAAGMAHAQCTSAIQSVSQQFVFPNHAAGPVASNGAVIVVAKTDPTDIFNALYVSAYNLSLSSLGADRKVADSTLGGPIALLSNGTDFALFYQTAGAQLTMQRIDAGGNLLGTPLAVAPQHTPTQNQDFDVIFDPARNGYVIVHTIPQGLDFGFWLTVLNRDGSVQFDQPITFFFGDLPHPRVASGTDGRLGSIWLRTDDPNSGIYLEIVDRANLPVITQRLTNTLPRFGNLLITTTVNDRYLILYGAPPPAATPPQPASIIWSVSVSQSGASSGAAPFISGRDVDDVAPISIIRNRDLGENALLYAYSRFGFANVPPDLRLRRFTPTDIPSDTFFSPNAAISPYQTTWPLVWTGSSYLDSVTRPGGMPRSEGTDTYLIKHCPFLATISADQGRTVPFRDVHFTIAPSGGTAPMDFVWDFGDLTVGQHGTSVTHAYARTGTYVVSIVGTDAAGARTTATFTVTVVDVIGRHRSVKK